MRDAQFSGQTSTTSFCEIRLKCKYFLRPLTAALANTDGLTSAVTGLHTPTSPQQRTEPANTCIFANLVPIFRGLIPLLFLLLLMNICWRLFWWGPLCVSDSHTLYSGWLVSMYCHLDHNNVGIMSVWNHYNSDFHWPNLIWVLDMFWRRILIVWVMNKLTVRTLNESGILVFGWTV